MIVVTDPLTKQRMLLKTNIKEAPGEADPEGKAYHAKLEERTKHLDGEMTILCGASFHLEHSVGGGQGLVVSGEGEVAEASLQVDDQVGGAVERERGVTRKKREPAMDRSGTLFKRRLVSFVQCLDRQVHQRYLAS